MSTATTRKIPKNQRAERSVLGACILDNFAIDEAAEILDREDFWLDAHAALWDAIITLRNSGQRVDVVTIAEHMTRLGIYKTHGGDDWLCELIESTPSAVGVGYYAAIVRQKSIARRTMQAAEEIIREGATNTHTGEALLSLAEQRFFAIMDRQLGGGTYNGEAMAASIRATMARRENGEVEGLSTGFPELDDMLLGLRSKEMIVLAGRPGEGKSAIGANIAWNVSQSGIPTLFVSLEMGHEELEERLVGSIASIDTRRLRDTALIRGLTCEERADRDNAISQIEHSRLVINDRAGQTMTQIAASARRHKLRGNLGFMVIDYLGYVNGEKKPRENENDVLTRISRSIKELAKELNIPILALHQLNRENEKEQRRPRKSDLRGSGSIEQDAHVILLLHSMIPEGEMIGPVEVIIDKNRNGRKGTVIMTFNKPFTRFESNALSGQIQNEVYVSPWEEGPEY